MKVVNDILVIDDIIEDTKILNKMADDYEQMCEKRVEKEQKEREQNRWEQLDLFDMENI